MSKMIIQCCIILCVISKSVKPIFLPAYKVNLTHEEEFIIGDWAEEDDKITNNEDEMIQADDIKYLRIEKDEPRYKRLHRHAKKYNKKELHYYKTKDVPGNYNETNFNLLEFKPWKMGFANEKLNFIHEENVNVFYQNAMLKQLVERKIENNQETTTMLDSNQYEEQDYEELKREYEMEIKEEAKLNETFNYTNPDEKETVKRVLGKMVDFKSTPRNCTNEELKGIGFGAAKCLWLDMHKPAAERNTRIILQSVLRICCIWLAIYAIIALLLWCHRGWCCCCCRCHFCRPHKRIEDAKIFLMNNPPGVYHTTDDKVIEYETNIHETYAYKQLREQLMNI